MPPNCGQSKGGARPTPVCASLSEEGAPERHSHSPRVPRAAKRPGAFLVCEPARSPSGGPLPD